MAGALLTTQTVMLCPHGGHVQAVTTNTAATIDGAPLLLAADHLPVVGCAFALPGPKPSPCVRVRWLRGSGTTTVQGRAVLTAASVGLCESAEGAPQGPPVLVSTPPQARER